MNTLTIKECTDMAVKTPAQHFLQSRLWAEFKNKRLLKIPTLFPMSVI